jgi:hypothetical protein
MSYFVGQACANLRPGVGVTVDEDGIHWHNVDNPPSDKEIAVEAARLAAEYPRKVAQAARASAYAAEADPLFFKAQRGEATIEEWEAKVEEIRTRYPYPVGLEVTP